MKKLLLLITLIFLSAVSQAQFTPTPNVGFEIPSNGSNNWNIPLNYNFNLLDQYLGGIKPIPALKITGNLTVGGSITAGSYIGVGGGTFPTISGTITANTCAYWVTTTTLGSQSCSGSTGTVTNFSAPSGLWPSWLVPAVLNPNTSPQLIVSATAIPNSALANSSTTVNGVPCILGSTCSIPPPSGSVTGTGTTGSIPVWSGTSTQSNSPLSVVNSPTTNGVLDSATFYGQDICWHYEAGGTPTAACLRYAGHGNYYGPYNTNDGVNFTPTPFSVGQLNVGQPGATGANGQAQAPSLMFYPGDTGQTGPVLAPMATIAMYVAQPTGACPNAGVVGAVPVWGFAPDRTISFCSNLASSIWQLFASGAATSYFPGASTVTISGSPVLGQSLLATGTSTAGWGNTVAYTSIAPVSIPFFGIVSAGDSRFAGQNTNITSTQNFIAQLNTQPQFAGRTTFATNGAVAGSTCSTMASNYTSHVFPSRPAANGGVPVFQYIMEGINDIRTAVSFNSWSSCYYAYLQTITADGFTPVISTIYYDASSFSNPLGAASQDLLRLQWNNFIRSLQGQIINGQMVRVFDADLAIGVSTNLAYATSLYDSPQANYAITGYSVASGVGTFTTSAANPPAASTTATFTASSASITVASATGIVLGQYITATGVPTGDYVASITGTTIGLAPQNTTATGTATAAIFNSPVLFSGFPSTSACLNASQTATVTYVSSTQFTMPVSCPNVTSSTDTGLAQAMYLDGLHLNPQAVATVLSPAANRDFAIYNSGTPATGTPPDRNDYINPISGTLYVAGNITASGTISPATLTAAAPLQSTTSIANGSFIKSTGGTAKLDISGSTGTEFVEFPTGSFWQAGTCHSADFAICNGTSAIYPFDISTTAPTNSLWVLGSGAAQSIGGFQSTNITAATSSVNNNSPALTNTGTYWTGTASAPDTWSWINVLGTGTNPISTYTLTHTGSSGAASVSIPGLAPLASPALTGTPTVPTASVGTNTTQAASTAYNQASFAAPPAIGSTTPNTVAASTIKSTATGTSASTAPICPNGTGGTYTTSGCATGSVTPVTATLNCSTSGTITFAETVVNSYDHEVAVKTNNCVGSVSYTFATPFATPPFSFDPAGGTNTDPTLTNNTTSTLADCASGCSTSSFAFVKGW